MVALLLWISLQKVYMCISMRGWGRVFYPNPSTLTHLFLVNYNYFKFLEMFTLWEKEKILCAFPISFPIWKTESYSSCLFFKK